VPQAGVFADVPTLVLSGELDTTTPSADAVLAITAFPNARHLVLANSFHVDALDDIANCAAPIVRRFIATLNPGDVACIDRIPAIRPAREFVRRTEETTSAVAAEGNAGTERHLAIAAAGVQTAADTLNRTWRNSGGVGLGLRGGQFEISRAGDVVRCVLRQVRWVEDLAVSGQLDWNQRTGDIHGDLSLAGPKSGGSIAIRWNALGSGQSASADGTIDRRAIHARTPAP